MSEDDTRRREPTRMIDVVSNSVAGATAAALSMVSGDPTVVVATGGAAPAVATALSRGVTAIVNARRNRAERLLVEAAATAGMTGDEVVERLAGTPHGLGLLTEAVVAAGDTPVDEHVTVLAHALARGASDESRIDHETMFVATMSDLGPAHVHMLTKFLGIPGVGGLARGIGFRGTVKLLSLRHAAGVQQELVEPILATLIRHGLVQAVDTGTWPSDRSPQDSDQSYKLTRYGLWCLQRLAEVGAVKETATEPGSGIN